VKRTFTEQEEAIALGMYRAEKSFSDIAVTLKCRLSQAERLIHQLIYSNFTINYPGLAGLTNRTAAVMVCIGVQNKEDATALLKTGTAHVYHGVGYKVISELASWTGVDLLEFSKGGYYHVEGQLTAREQIDRLNDKIDKAKDQIAFWRSQLAILKRDPYGFRHKPRRKK
jgi:hypothetical protein